MLQDRECFREMSKTLFCIWEARAFFRLDFVLGNTFFAEVVGRARDFFSGAPHFFWAFLSERNFLEHLELFGAEQAFMVGVFDWIGARGRFFYFERCSFFGKLRFNFSTGRDWEERIGGPFCLGGFEFSLECFRERVIFFSLDGLELFFSMTFRSSFSGSEIFFEGS